LQDNVTLKRLVVVHPIILDLQCSMDMQYSLA
jgi:hypothetical protein